MFSHTMSQIWPSYKTHYSPVCGFQEQNESVCVFPTMFGSTVQYKLSGSLHALHNHFSCAFYSSSSGVS